VLTDEPHWREHHFRAMGSPAHLIVATAPEPLVEWAATEVERLEQAWSRFRPDSELSRLGARAGEWVPVSPELLRALVRARRLWERTAGAFDPTILNALVSLGYDRTFAEVERVGAPGDVSSGPVAGFGVVEVDEIASAVRLPPGIGLDLGGLGKGLAADLVAEGLLLRGASSALVALGGDIRTAGDTPDGGWCVPVLDPFDADAVWRDVVLDAEAIVTSTSLMRRWRRGEHDLHHIIDPITGMPSEGDVVAVVARGPEAWWAEGLAKAAMVLGEAGAGPLLEGTGVTATLFRADGSAAPVGDEVMACSPS
jgi:thiamine biosynthesis lipoprotein